MGCVARQDELSAPLETDRTRTQDLSGTTTPGTSYRYLRKPLCITELSISSCPRDLYSGPLAEVGQQSSLLPAA